MTNAKKKSHVKGINAGFHLLRLPGMRQHWQELAERSDQEGWPSADYTAQLVEIETTVREQNRMSRHLKGSRLYPGKTLDRFDFSVVPMIKKPHVMALSSGGDWISNGSNIIFFGPPGVGKTHLACGLGHALIEHGYQVKFFQTNDLVQQLQRAQQNYTFDSMLARLDKIPLLILDDFVYASKDQSETNVLFELINARYERRSLIITANQSFEEWQQIFPGPAMTTAVVDRLYHRSFMYLMNVKSYRRREADNRIHQQDADPSIEESAS